MAILSKKKSTNSTDAAIKAIPDKEKFAVIKETAMVIENQKPY